MKDLEIIAECIRQQHGTEITAQDLIDIHRFHWEKSQTRQRLSAANDPYYEDVSADVGKIITVVVGAALGAVFLPALGIASGWVVGALIGASIGYKLTQLFDTPAAISPSATPVRSPVRSPAGDPSYGFSGVGQLVTLGANIPKIYCNRSINPSGGIYFRDPPKVYTRVYSKGGVRYLASAGVLAFGELGQINSAGLKLDDKPLSDWEAGDITTSLSHGLHSQGSLLGFPNYSQAMSINANAFVGIGKSVVAGTTRTDRSAAIIQDPVGVIATGNEVIKNSIGGWNAGARTQSLTLSAGYGSFVVVEGLLSTTSVTDPIRSAIGISATNTNADLASMDVAIEVFGGTLLGWRVWRSGVELATGTIPSTATASIGVRYYNSAPTRCVELYLAGKLIYRVNVDLGTAVFGDLSLFNALDKISNILVAALAFNPGGISPGFGTKFQVSADVFPQLKPTQFYRSTSGAELIIVGRDAANGVVEFGAPIMIGGSQIFPANLTDQILEGAAISSGFRSTITTSKAVDAIEILLQASIYARDESGQYIAHGQAFKIQLKNSVGVIFTIQDFIIVSSIESTVAYTIAINGLAKGIYQILLTPLSSSELEAATIRLVPDQSISTFASKSAGIIISAEIGNPVLLAAATTYLSFAGKAQVSSDRGAEVQVTHINEIVTPSTPPTYAGYTMETSLILASDRLQSAPSESWDIPSGAIVPNYLAFSTTAISGDNARISTVEAIAPNLLQVGDLARILLRGTRVITSVASGIYCAEITTTITSTANSPILTLSAGSFANVLQWMPVAASSLPSGTFVIKKYADGTNRVIIGDEWGRSRLAASTGSVSATFNSRITERAGADVVFYRMASSNYFPDIYTDRLINPIDGLGNYVDRDHFIDYESIVYSRAFCARNQYYFDAVISDGSFEQWALTSAPSSLLFCTTIEGRYALIPQEGRDPNPFLFNDSNVIKYSEPGVPWQSQLTNAMLVKYQNNQGRERQIKIVTSDLAAGTDVEVAQSINAQGVTSKSQAIKVGQTSLKSVRLQGRVCQIETDIASGLYTRQGKIIRTQHTTIEHDNERSGFVMTVQAIDNPRSSTVRSIPIFSCYNGYLVATDNHYLNRNDTGILDSIEISGNTNPLNNAVFPSAQLRWVDERSVTISPSATSGGGTGGLLKIVRQISDQIISLSEPVVVTASSRITITHRTSRKTEEDKLITDMGNGLFKVIGIEGAISPGDAWAIGELGTSNRYWRVSSIQPSVKNNTVTLTGVYWDDDILSPSGLVTID